MYSGIAVSQDWCLELFDTTERRKEMEGGGKEGQVEGGRGWYLTIRQMVAVWVGRDVMEAREHKIKIRKIQDLP